MAKLAGHGQCEGCGICVVDDTKTLAEGRYVLDAEGVPVRNRPISAFELIPGGLTAPCELNTRETSGDPDNWPGSPCLVEQGLCLTCGAREAVVPHV